MVDADGFKACYKCGERKLASECFYRVKTKRSDGYGPYCKSCTKAAAVAWQKANPEKKSAADRKQSKKPQRKKQAAERAKQWAIKNPEKAIEKHRAWRAANPDKSKAIRKRHYDANRQKCLAATKAYYSTPEGRIIRAERERNRRTMKRAGPGFTRSAWHRLLDAFNRQCCFCGTDGPMELEHLTPVSRGGGNLPGNLAPACAPCNGTKWAKTAEEFAPDRAAEIRRIAKAAHEAET